MMKTTRRERIREAAREEIKTTAWKQIGAVGAAGLSLRAIASDMGITAPALYRYFKDRDDLVTALIIDAFSSFADALEASLDACSPEDYAGRFRSLSLAYREWAITYPQRYILIFGTPISGYELSEEASLVSQRSFLVLVDLIGEAYQAGAIHLSPESEAMTPGLQRRLIALQQECQAYSPVVTQLALASWSWIHGLTSLELYGYLPSFLGDQVEDFICLELDAFMRTLGLK